MSRPVRPVPREVAPAWPDEPSGDPAVEAVRRFAQAVRAAVGTKSLREVAETCGLSHVTVMRVLNGEAWPDAATIARLEEGLGQPLWPTYPRA